jgi:hypothetical protein
MSDVVHVLAFFLMLACIVAPFIVAKAIETSSRDYEEFKAKQLPQPSPKELFEMEVITRLKNTCEQLAGIKGSLTAIECDTRDNSGDLEALRRTIHEMKSDIKRISSVFATVPTAEVPND